MGGSGSAGARPPDGGVAGGDDGGVRVENTCGKPWLFKNVCSSLKIDGTCGRILSIECKMSERVTAASSEAKRLLGDVITPATSQTESSTAITATPTPR